MVTIVSFGIGPDDREEIEAAADGEIAIIPCGEIKPDDRHVLLMHPNAYWEIIDTVCSQKDIFPWQLLEYTRTVELLLLTSNGRTIEFESSPEPLPEDVLEFMRMSRRIIVWHSEACIEEDDAAMAKVFEKYLDAAPNEDDWTWDQRASRMMGLHLTCEPGELGSHLSALATCEYSLFFCYLAYVCCEGTADGQEAFFSPIYLPPELGEHLLACERCNSYFDHEEESELT